MILKITGSEIGYSRDIGKLFDRETVLSAHWRPKYITWSDRIIMTDVSRIPYYYKSGGRTLIQLDGVEFCVQETVDDILKQVESGGYHSTASSLGHHIPRRVVLPRR